jgi:hypothetical protein
MAIRHQRIGRFYLAGGAIVSTAPPANTPQYHNHTETTQ